MSPFWRGVARTFDLFGRFDRPRILSDREAMDDVRETVERDVEVMVAAWEGELTDQERTEIRARVDAVEMRLREAGF